MKRQPGVWYTFWYNSGGMCCSILSIYTVNCMENRPGAAGFQAAFPGRQERDERSDIMNLNNLLEMQGVLILLMLLGLFLTEIGMIQKEHKSFLTTLVVYVTLPASIVKAFDVPLEPEILTLGGLMVLMNALVLGGGMLLGKVAYRRYGEDQRKVLEYATIVSNAGILGNPVAEGAFGSMGLLYASIYLIPQRIFMWSVGVSMFTGQGTDWKKTLKKTVTHPCIVAVAVGMLLMMTPLTLPGFLGATVKSLAGANTPACMLLVGSLLGGVKLREIVDRDSLYYCVIRLFVIPGVTLLCCRLFHVDELVSGVVVLLTAMPAASTTAVLSAQYGRDSALASRLVAISTILSVVTAPLWCLLL